jgi:hypothetical protein
VRLSPLAISATNRPVVPAPDALTWDRNRSTAVGCLRWGHYFLRNHTGLNNSSLALQPFVGPWPLFQFNNLFSMRTVGLLGRGISPSQGRYIHTGQQKHRINEHTDIHALSGIRTHDSSVRPSENSSPLDRAATVIGLDKFHSVI